MTDSIFPHSSFWISPSLYIYICLNSTASLSRFRSLVKMTDQFRDCFVVSLLFMHRSTLNSIIFRVRKATMLWGKWWRPAVSSQPILPDVYKTGRTCSDPSINGVRLVFHMQIWRRTGVRQSSSQDKWHIAEVIWPKQRVTNGNVRHRSNAHLLIDQSFKLWTSLEAQLRRRVMLTRRSPMSCCSKYPFRWKISLRIKRKIERRSVNPRRADWASIFLLLSASLDWRNAEWETQKLER